MSLILFNTLLVGLTIATVLIFAGFQGWPFLLTILVGGIFQVVFRITKRLYINKAKRSSKSEPGELVLNEGKPLESFTLKVLLSMYILMLPICTIFFGMGYLAKVVLAGLGVW